MFALNAAFLVMQFDRAADFFMRRQHGFVLLADAERRQHAPHEELDRGDDGAENGDDPAHGPCHREREAVGAGDGERFGQHLGENEDDKGHHHGRDRDRAFAQGRREQGSRQ